MNRNYISSMLENDTPLSTFVPTDLSDVGQARVLADAYRHCLCYCKGMGWMKYKDGVWVQSDIAAHALSQKLTCLQLEEALNVRNCNISAKRVFRSDSDEEKYLKYIAGRRASGKISATLKEAIPMLSIETADLDADPLILNTPAGEVHLDTGEIAPHDPAHHITHITKSSPSEENAEIWSNFLNQIACGDEAIADFLQQFAGMAAIGKVYEERLVIALGSGGNGKSTFFNAIQDVLGDYAGTIRSELLIASNDSGKKFEFARLRGKRFLVAEELEEGKQMDTAAIKHLCSTGDINAQFKGKDIFTFKPSHSTVLCTNHRPAVKAVDNGTWDRLIVVPFKGRFRNQSGEVKNYGAYLVENCGGAILKWIIEGAQKYIQNEYKLIIPESIQEEIHNYQVENDWASGFFQKCLRFDPKETATATELYSAYKTYCEGYNILQLPSTKVMPRIAEQFGVSKTRTRNGFLYKGVGLSMPKSLILLEAQTGSDYSAEEDEVKVTEEMKAEAEEDPDLSWDHLFEELFGSTLSTQNRQHAG